MLTRRDVIRGLGLSVLAVGTVGLLDGCGDEPGPPSPGGGTDADGDGVADPNDIDDAAGAAVAYLCADGHDLTSGAGWADAIFGYNHDDSYVANVHSAAEAYAERTS